MVSASRRWLIDTMMPMLIHVPMTWLTPTFIIVASSLTVTNSVSFSTLLSADCAAISSCMRSCTASRFSLRYFAPFLFCPFEVSRASVSFTWRATSSSFTSSMRWLRFLFLGFFSLFFGFCDCFSAWLAAALMSTRSLLMRTRFFFSPRCSAFSSRSLRRSSLLFFFGRVLWLSESRSILPSTFTCGAAFCSLFSVNTFCSCVSCFGVSGAGFSVAVCAVAGSSFLATGAVSFLGSSFCTGFVSSFFGRFSAGACCFGSSFFSVAADFLAAGFLFRLSRSIFPTVFTCGFSVTVSITAGSGRFFSFWCLGKMLAASFLVSLSPLNSSTSAAYCLSFSLKEGMGFTSPKLLFFSRNSTAVWSPMFSSPIALLNLMLIYLFLRFYDFSICRNIMPHYGVITLLRYHEIMSSRDLKPIQTQPAEPPAGGQRFLPQGRLSLSVSRAGLSAQPWRCRVRCS